MEYQDCLVELDEVLRFLSKEDLEKIPEDIRQNIKEQKSKDYTWHYDVTKNLNEQNLNRKTIAMLCYLNMEYLVNSEQKKLLEQMHQLNEQKAEDVKNKKYNAEDLFKNIKKGNDQEEAEVPVVAQKQPWYAKIKKFFKNIFNIRK